MAERSGASLCDGCPGEGNYTVDYGVHGSCPTLTVDSFMQARRLWLTDKESYGDVHKLAEIVGSGLMYYDEEKDDNYFSEGSETAALIGGLCAQQFLDGGCTKTRDEILRESETD